MATRSLMPSLLRRATSTSWSAWAIATSAAAGRSARSTWLGTARVEVRVEVRVKVRIGVGLGLGVGFGVGVGVGIGVAPGRP